MTEKRRIRTSLLDIDLLKDPLDCGDRLQTLPPQRVEKLRALKHARTRRQSFGAALLLELQLREDGRAADGPLEFVYNSAGKPYIKGMEDYSFCLSHSGGVALLSVGGDVRVGCDVEQLRFGRRLLAAKYFTEKEQKQLADCLDEGKAQELFCRLWTRKESVLKLTGLGLALPMNTFDVSEGDRVLADGKLLDAWLLGLSEKRQESEERYGDAVLARRILREETLFLRDYRYKDYRICVCACEDRFEPEIFIKNPCIDRGVVLN